MTDARRSPKQSDAVRKAVDLGSSLGGVFEKFGSVIEKLAELAETGEELSRTGEIKGLDPSGKVRGVYGFSIRSGIGDRGEKEIKVEPFGNIRKEPSGKPVVEDTREPMVDVHEENDHVLVLAEIPGISKKDVELELCGDQLTVGARRGDKRYRKVVTLPGVFSPDRMRSACKNGILKIRLDR